MRFIIQLLVSFSDLCENIKNNLNQSLNNPSLISKHHPGTFPRSTTFNGCAIKL